MVNQAMSKEPKSTLLPEIRDLFRKHAEYEAEKRRGYNEPRFALGVITGGLGISEMTVRNWLTRGQIMLSEEREKGEGKHRRFSIKDAIRIAAAYQLSMLGAPVSFRSDLAEKVAGYAESLFSRVQGTLRNPVILIFNDGDWKFRHTFDDGPFRITEMEDLPPAVTMLNVHKLIIDTLRPLGVEVAFGTADEIRQHVASRDE